ncbi:MAG: hypothetical protein LBG42_01825 [Treponema sp.]|jgi:hypothetical protein|nr:hypothetical protein [Treponema sp.]
MGQRRLFMTLMRAELEDSIEGLEHLSGLLKDRLLKDEITNYVFNENAALLTREISGLKSLIPALEEIKSGDFPDVYALARYTEETLLEKAKEWEDPEAVNGIITRKIRKILAYILELPE